jgi:hypothetical protein
MKNENDTFIADLSEGDRPLFDIISIAEIMMDLVEEKRLREARKIMVRMIRIEVHITKSHCREIFRIETRTQRSQETEINAGRSTCKICKRLRRTDFCEISPTWIEVGTRIKKDVTIVARAGRTKEPYINMKANLDQIGMK